MGLSACFSGSNGGNEEEAVQTNTTQEINNNQEDEYISGTLVKKWEKRYGKYTCCCT